MHFSIYLVGFIALVNQIEKGLLKNTHSMFLECWNTTIFFQRLTTFFMSTWWGDCENIQEIKSHDGFLSYLQKINSQSSPSGSTFLPCLGLPAVVFIYPAKSCYDKRSKSYFFPFLWEQIFNMEIWPKGINRLDNSTFK